MGKGSGRRKCRQKGLTHAAGLFFEPVLLFLGTVKATLGSAALSLLNSSASCRLPIQVVSSKDPPFDCNFSFFRLLTTLPECYSFTSVLRDRHRKKEELETIPFGLLLNSSIKVYSIRARRGIEVHGSNNSL